MNNYVIFDLETTGLDREKDQIIQFAGIKINKETNKIVDQKNLYIQPIGNYNISIQSFFKHGIKATMLVDKPYFKDVAKELFEFFNDSDIITYNGVSFDIPFLVNEFKKCGIDFTVTNVDCYDAFLEEKRRNGNTLEDTYKRYKGKSMEDAGLTAHDALSDVKATYSVFVAQQRNQSYGPEQIFGDDNVISMKEFNNELCPCFNVGKYKNLSIGFVQSIDKNYLNWTVSDNCNFSKLTKEFIKKYIT